MLGMLEQKASINSLILFAADSVSAKREAVSWQDVDGLRKTAAFAMTVGKWRLQGSVLVFFFFFVRLIQDGPNIDIPAG